MTQLTPSSEDVRIYEICLLYPHPMQQKEEQELMKGIDELFKEANVTVLQSDKWGRRGLAYKIGGHEEGNFVVYYVEIPPENLKERDSNLRILPGVLRHIFVKPPNGYEVVDYSKKFEEWQQDKEKEVEEAAKEREEQLKQRMLMTFKKAEIQSSTVL